MQERPDKATLMDAVARFLTEDVRPHVADRGLSFRVLIAANLATIVAREIRVEEEHDRGQLTRLRALMPDVPLEGVETREQRTEALRTLNEALAQRVRERSFDEKDSAAVWGHVSATLRDKLSVINPRFDLSPRMEA